MKKNIVVMMSLILGVVGLAGCTNNSEAFTEKSYLSENQEITNINIDVADRQVEVLLSPDNQIHIDYFENSQEYYDISVSDDQTLTMTAATDKKWQDYIGGKAAADSRKISLQVPDALLATLKITTTNENIILPALTVNDDVALSAQGGSLVFDKLDAGKTISLSAKNGDITGSIEGTYEDFAISSESKKGESNLPENKEQGGKTLAVSNNNGDVAIDFVNS